MSERELTLTGKQLEILAKMGEKKYNLLLEKFDTSGKIKNESGILIVERLKEIDDFKIYIKDIDQLEEMLK